MPILLWIVIAFVLAGLTLRPLSDPDLWWHLVIGRWMVSHDSVPVQDHWNEFAAGDPWLAYSWLAEVIFAKVELSGGLSALLALKWILGAFSLIVFGLCLCRTAKHWTAGFSLALLVGIACYPYFGLRPQVFSWICAMVVLYFAEQICQRSRRPLDFVFLAITMTVWANVHLTTVFGVVMAVFWVLGTGRVARKTVPIVFGCCFLATLITPYFGKEWLTLLGKSQHPFTHMYIKEFQPSNLFVYSTPVLILLLVCMFVLQKKYEKFEMPTPRIILGIFFFLAALTVQKFAPYAAIILAMNIACMIGRPTKRLTVANVPWPSTLFLGSGAAIVTVGLLFSMIRFRTMSEQPIDESLVAVAPVSFIEQHQLPWPVLNGFNDGGYLLYRQASPNGVPYNRVSLDGRTNVNSKEVAESFLKALHGSHGWQSYFELVKPKTVLWEQRFPLVPILRLSEDWCEVYPLNGTSGWSVFLSREEYSKRQKVLKSSNCFPEKAVAILRNKTSTGDLIEELPEPLPAPQDL